MLVDVCERLKRTFSDQTIGRIGGDEFIVFTIGMQDKADVLKKAEQLCELFQTIMKIFRSFIKKRISLSTGQKRAGKTVLVCTRRIRTVYRKFEC